ncbi:hypothetical protein [Chishuiella sp.]|uniref:hypothetical protein n=1 Tax=Chishuiella sp. TaxID=1969467 RepID=UPI0028A9F207|nr:hypothetical protein [Chishuiella sp.]
MNYKKILTISIVTLLILVGVAIIIGSNKYRRVFFIDSFHNPIESKISSKPNKDYSYEIVRIKGNTNDTIIIQPCQKCEKLKLSGKINQKFMNEFKTGESIMHFKPYKATKGKLKIVHKIR